MSAPISAINIVTPSAPTTSSSSGPKNERHHGETRMKHVVFALAALSFGATAAQADIVRTPIPNSTFPIAQAVRAVVGVAALANPGFLVEIEVVAAKDSK